MKLTRERKTDAIIPTASMADIAFLLIIFFMVTTVTQVDRTRVDLPLSKQNLEAKPEAAVVVVHDIGNDQVEYKFSNGKDMSDSLAGPEEVWSEAQQVMYEDSTKQFMLKADGNVRFYHIDQIMDTLRRAGVRQLLLLTQEGDV